MSAKTTRFEKLLEAVPDALVGMDQKGVIQFVNRQTESLFGYDRDQLIGQPVETLVPEPLWQIYVQHKENYFADPRTRSSGLDVVLGGRHQDGTEFPINVSLSHIDTGDVLLVITAVGDVARQMQAVKNAQLTTAIVQYSDDAIIGNTLAGVITSWNPAAEQMYGYSAKEIINKSGSLLISEDRVVEMNDVLARVKDGQVVEHFETTLVRKDGTGVPVSITVAPIRDEDGAVVGVSGVHRDVSEQRQAFETAQRLARIVESSDDAIIGETLDGIVTSWNPAAARMFGYSAAEIVGRSARLLVPEDQVGQFTSVRAKVSAGQHVEHLETFNVRKDGTVFPISLTVSPIRDDGAVVGVSVICRDLTEQQKALETAQRLAAIVEYSDDAILASTLDGIITIWNRSAARLFGYSAAEIVGKPISLLAPEDRADEIRANLAKVRAGQHLEHMETVRVRKDGTMFPVSLTVSPICDAGGTIVGASVIYRDVSELKRAAEYVRSLIEVARDPLMTISPEGTINDVNEATVKATGVPREALIGTDFSQYFTDPDEAHEVYQRAFTQGSVTDYPLTLRHAGGTLTDLLCNASVYRDISGGVLGVSAIGRDVTEQNQAREVVQRMVAIVESSEDAIISGSLDGIITSWNPAAERMLGYSSAEIVGKPATFLTPKDRAGEMHAVLAKISAGQHVESFETKRVRKDGTVFPVSLSVSPIRGAGGAVVGTSVIYRDLTEQKGALAVAQRLAAIVEGSDDAIVGRTLDDIVTSWNPAAERMFGYFSAEIVGKPISLLTPEDRAGERISILAKISAGHPVENFETIRIRKDGTVFPVSLTTSPIRDEKGTVVGASVIYRDVSELKHAAQYARSLIEAALDPLMTISPEGKICDVNEATVKATGVPRSKLIGTDFSGYFTDPDKAHQAYQRAFTQGTITDYPLTLRHHRDGTLTDVLYNASVYRDTGGNVLGVCAAARDVAK